MNWYKYSKISNKLKYAPLLAIPASIPLWIGDGSSNQQPNQIQYTKIKEPLYNNSIKEDTNQEKLQPTLLQQKEDIQNNTKKNIEKENTIKSSNLVTAEEMLPIISLNEGRSNIAYEDSLGYKTIGIGFCLELSIRKDAKQKIQSVGGNYERIYNKQETLSDNQIFALAKQDIDSSILVANAYCGDLSSHPKNVQKAIVDMAFNLGPNRLNNFVKLKQALINKNYTLAAQEMKDSKWFKQVGQRGPRMTNYMLGNN